MSVGDGINFGLGLLIVYLAYKGITVFFAAVIAICMLTDKSKRPPSQSYLSDNQAIDFKRTNKNS